MSKLQRYEKCKKVDLYGQLLCLIVPSLIAIVVGSKDFIIAALSLSVLWQLLSLVFTWSFMPKLFEDNRREDYGLFLLVLILISLFVGLLLPKLLLSYYIIMLVAIPISISAYIIITYKELQEIRAKLISTCVYRVPEVQTTPATLLNKTYKRIKLVDLLGQFLCIILPFVFAIYKERFIYAFYAYFTVGGWQILSYLYNWIYVPKEFKSGRRRIYGKILLSIIIVLGIGFILIPIFNNVVISIVFLMVILLIGIVPVLVVYYIDITNSEMRMKIIEKEGSINGLKE